MAIKDSTEELEECNKNEFWLKQQGVWKRLNVVLLIYISIIIVAVVFLVLAERGLFSAVFSLSNVIIVFYYIFLILLFAIVIITPFVIVATAIFGAAAVRDHEPNIKQLVLEKNFSELISKIKKREYGYRSRPEQGVFKHIYNHYEYLFAALSTFDDEEVEDELLIFAEGHGRFGLYARTALEIIGWRKDFGSLDEYVQYLTKRRKITNEE